MPTPWIDALVGGVLIGASVSLMLLFNGRVTGISGIVYGLFTAKKSDFAWRTAFVFGLIAGGALLTFFLPPISFSENFSWKIPIAGLLVGFGTVLGSGCTSGHGICGVSRLSPRSLAATVLFIISGIITVFFWQNWAGTL